MCRKIKNVIILLLLIINISSCVQRIKVENEIIRVSSNEKIQLLEQSSKITGPFNIGYSAVKSNEWKLYEEIKQEYDSEELYDEYFKNNSIIVKIYLYLILWERNYDNIENIENDLVKYNNEILVFFPGGCEVFYENVESIIKNIKLDIEFLKLPDEEKQKILDEIMEKIYLMETIDSIDLNE